MIVKAVKNSPGLWVINTDCDSALVHNCISAEFTVSAVKLKHNADDSHPKPDFPSFRIIIGLLRADKCTTKYKRPVVNTKKKIEIANLHFAVVEPEHEKLPLVPSHDPELDRLGNKIVDTDGVNFARCRR